MNVAEFIEWLKTQDQDAIVMVMVQDDPPGYESYGPCTETVFTPKLTDYTDFRQYEWSKGTPNEGKRTLVLGERDG